jgi:divalent metal cation (Fe/Co/Zn/Cd) transporter
VTTAEQVAAQVPGVRHAHARARWTGRTLRLEVEGWLDAGTSVAEADAVGREVARTVGQELPDVRSFSWTARPV